MYHRLPIYVHWAVSLTYSVVYGSLDVKNVCVHKKEEAIQWKQQPR